MDYLARAKTDPLKDREAVLSIAYQILEYSEQLHDAPTIPEIPAPFANDERFNKYHDKLLSLRTTLFSFAKGDLSPTIIHRGVVAGACKSLQANLRHLVWIVQQVEKGDYTQRVDFLGNFSSAFNNMVIQLASTIEALKQKEEALTSLAVSLQAEVRKRSETLQELKKSEANFKYLAQHDYLTGTLNRRYFFTFAEAQLESSRSLESSCCVCILDVDNFKKFNDTYGHMEGDRALKHIVEHGTNALRQSDIMGRFGGEEFIFLFPDADMEQGQAVAERIRCAIENNPLILENGSPVTLTASLGVSEIIIEKDAQHIIEKKLKPAITQADKALYIAKALGRNQVCIAND